MPWDQGDCYLSGSKDPFPNHLYPSPLETLFHTPPPIISTFLVFLQYLPWRASGFSASFLAVAHPQSRRLGRRVCSYACTICLTCSLGILEAKG